MNHHAHLTFALDPGITFLNHGSFGAAPRVVTAARRTFEDRLEAQPVSYLWDAWMAATDAVAADVAAFVGADPADLTLIENATTGVAAVLHSLDWAAGDRVVVLSHVYAAVHNAVKALALRHGVQVVVAEVPFPLHDPAEAVRALDGVLPGAKLAVLDHITSPTGLVLPLPDLLACCRAHDVPVLVDGAHAPGHVPLDLSDLDCDYYVGNLHKWAFAARGTALLWVRPGRGPLHALVTSHGWDGSLQDRFHWPGTRDFTAWLSTPTALQLHATLGGPALMDRNREVAAEAGTWLAEHWGVDLPAPPELRAALCAVPLTPRFRLDPADPLGQTRALSRVLWRKHRIEVPILPFAGRAYTRFSVQIYNEVDDVERLAHAVDAELAGT